MITTLLILGLIGIYVGNIAVTTGLCLYDVVWCMFICREESPHFYSYEYMQEKWSILFEWELDGEELAFIFIAIEVVCGALLVGLLSLLIVTGIIWYLLGILAILYGVRHIHDRTTTSL